MTSDPAGKPQPSTDRRITTGVAHRIRRAVLPALLLTGMVAAALPVPSSAASAGITFGAGIGWCFHVQGRANTSAKVTWRSASGRLKGRFSGVSDANGRFADPDGCTPERVTSGDRITAKYGTVSRTLTVPVLTVSFDRVNYHVSGRGPIGSWLDVIAARQNSVVGPEASCITLARVHSNGHYSVNVQGILGGPYCPPEYTPMGGDVAQVTWTSAHQDSVYQFATAPMVGVTVGKSSFYGRAAAGQSVSVVLRTSSGAVRGRAHLTVDARATGFTLIFRDGNGHSVPVRSGDRVTGDWATNATFDVPDMHFTPIPIYHLFYGWCMPNAPYTLTLLMAGYQAETTSGTTGANGETPLMQVSGHVKTGETMTLACALPTGDVVTFSQLVP